MKLVHVLLDGPIRSDARVIRSIRSLSRLARIDLFYPQPKEGDDTLFGEGVTLRPTLPPPRAPSLLRRCVTLHREFDFLADAALDDEETPDLVLANDYPTLAPAARLAVARGAKLVYDAHELWLETANQFFPPAAPFLRRIAFRILTGTIRAIGRRVERRAIQTADLVITANGSYAAWFARSYGISEPLVIRNLPLEDAAPERERAPGRGAGGTVLYQGVMNPGRGLEALVRAAARFPEGVRLVLLGDGMRKPELERIAGEVAPPGRVKFREKVEYERLLRETVKADLGALLIEPINLSKRYSLANKLFEYMAAGVPVLATDLPEHRKVLDDTGAGWIVPRADPDGIAAAVERAFEDGTELARRGAAGRAAFLDRYHYEVDENCLLAAASGLLARPRAD